MLTLSLSLWLGILANFGIKSNACTCVIYKINCPEKDRYGDGLLCKLCSLRNERQQSFLSDYLLLGINLEFYKYSKARSVSHIYGRISAPLAKKGKAVYFVIIRKLFFFERLISF